MSGRDFKTFLTAHQSQIGQQDQKLVTRFLSGHKPLYKPVDYEKVEALAKIRKSSGNRALKKVEKLKKDLVKSREEQLFQEHKRLWETESRKLKASEERLTFEISLLRPGSPNFAEKTTAKEEVYEDITDFEDLIRYDFKEFERSTVDPIMLLREDLLAWLHENRSKLLIGYHDKDKEEEITRTVNSVQEQQSLIMEQLEIERLKLEDQLVECNTSILSDTNSTAHRMDSARSTTTVSSFYGGSFPNIVIGVPKELYNVSCPDQDLWLACFEEFDVLDERYGMEIEDLEDKFNDVISRMPNNGWNEDDCLRFRHIMNQYSSVSHNRRKLYLHRLRLELPHKSIQEIKDFEEFAFRRKNFQSRLKSLFLAWQRDREDFTLRVRTLFQEATSQYTKRQKAMVEHTKQRFVCNFLREKLNDYREERCELMKLEAEERAVLEGKEKEKQSAKQKKEQARRDHGKKMISAYKERQQINTQQLKELDQMRMLELQERRAVQRFHDMERVQYREVLRIEKEEEVLFRKLEQEQEDVEKEQRIQRITEQVNAQVKYDPNRVLEPTQTTIAHARVEEYEERDTQAPLFNVYTYNVDQVAQDKRLKIEAALRRANLHMTDYGRNIMSNVPPPSKPRKDMQSTAFKQS